MFVQNNQDTLSCVKELCVKKTLHTIIAASLLTLAGCQTVAPNTKVQAFVVEASSAEAPVVKSSVVKNSAVDVLSAEAPVTAVAKSSRPYAVVLPQQKGAVATVQPLATQAAVDAFNAGGNAIDAALAAAFTLGVVDSHNSGIGGGCFIIVRLASGKVLAIDGREMAPAKAHRDMYLRDGKADKNLSKTGALSVGVPGSVMAYHHLQQLGGQLTFADVLLPAANLAEAGFAIDYTLANRLGRTSAKMAQFPASKAVFFKDGQPLVEGQILKQPDLARSYRALAKQGPNWFYVGDFAQKTANWMASNGGLITRADFANYQVLEREPIRSQFKGYDVYGFGPPSSGGTHVAQMLNILESDSQQLATMPEAERYHLMIEAMKLAFADRSHWLGDTDFVPVPKGLVAPAYGQKLRALIDSAKAATVTGHHLPPEASTRFFYEQLNKHTTHLTTADSEGNWVAITTTLNTSFGSKAMVPNTGVLLNNQMDDFATAPGVPNAFGLVGAEANSIAPYKRPLSSMSPTLVLKEGQPVLTLGAAGGPTIITQVTQALINYLALNKPLEQAIDTPRVHQQWLPEWVFTELPLEGKTAQALKAKGHNLKRAGDFGGTQAIGFKDGQFTAVTEPRIIRRNTQ